jgi:hypothetical protein
VQKKVRGYQRYLCNKLKSELFDNILQQNGFDPEKEECVVAFTTQNIIALETEQVKGLTDTGVMTKMEAREWLRVNTGMELPDDDKIIADEEMAKDMMTQDNTKPDSKPKEEVFRESQCICKCGACKESQHTFCSGKKRSCQ